MRRDGRLYLLEARPYLGREAAARIAAAFGLTTAELPRTVERLLDVGPEALGDRTRGTAFWRSIWDALRLEERLVGLEGLAQAPLPRGLDDRHLEELLAEAPEDVRFHLSRGAAESFVNTLPLLHPRGYLQVQDIFVTAMAEYRHGFRDPGKLDGEARRHKSRSRNISARGGVIPERHERTRRPSESPRVPVDRSRQPQHPSPPRAGFLHAPHQ